MRRRAILGAAAGAALQTPIAAAQTRDHVRRIGALLDLPAGDERAQTRLAAFQQGLQEAGWSIGRNLRIDLRWREPTPERLAASAGELVALKPEAILASSTPVAAALRAATREVPVVFVLVVDPIGAGFVESVARPGGNMTGFTTFDPALSAKWLEILREASPGLARVALVEDPSLPASAAQRDALVAAARTLGVAMSAIDANDPVAMEQGLETFAREPNGGLVVGFSPLTGLHRDRIVAAAARLRLPAVYPFDHFAPAGGLIAYGPSAVEPYRLAAGYVDRILRGARPAELPVRGPDRLEMIVNLRTARDLGIALPQSLVLRADEVIE